MREEITIPEGMKAYGPNHPDYPNQPQDWDHGAYLCRDGGMYHMAGYGWQHGLYCYAPIADYDRIAYRPALPLAPTPTQETQAGDVA